MTRVAKYSWGVLGFNLLVILWGAYVRATGSGAGCGSHWPSCNGVIIPRNAQLETLIEFTHRLSSGIAFLLVFALLVWVWRVFPKGHLVRRGAIFSFIFIIIEALLGAGLVLFELVADNDSFARAISMAVHLANTFLLLGSLTLTSWWASGGEPMSLHYRRGMAWLFFFGFLGIVVLGMTGAVTALGDTLFPADSLVEGILQDTSPTAHFLIRLRVIHPLTAVLVGGYLLVVGLISVLNNPRTWVKRFSASLLVLFFVQLIAGMINLVLLAPIPMQIIHLFLADLVWVVFVLLSAVTLTSRTETEMINETKTIVSPEGSIQSA